VPQVEIDLLEMGGFPEHLSQQILVLMKDLFLDKVFFFVA
jgi:hypothetical protein